MGEGVPRGTLVGALIKLRKHALALCLIVGAAYGLGAAVADDVVPSPPDKAAAAPPAPKDAPGVPPRPEEPRAAKAYDTLSTHCARCHQTGRLERPLASGGLSNILAIDDLARDPVLVKPGVPDASRLYDVLETRHAPLDVFTSGSVAAASARSGGVRLPSLATATTLTAT